MGARKPVRAKCPSRCWLVFSCYCVSSTGRSNCCTLSVCTGCGGAARVFCNFYFTAPGRGVRMRLPRFSGHIGMARLIPLLILGSANFLAVPARAQELGTAVLNGDVAD